MAIYRVSIEVLQGERSGDSPESRAAALERLGDLRDDIFGTTEIARYPEGEAAPWGVPMRPETFNLDFDSELSSECPGDAVVFQKVTDWFLQRP